ncbi:hypothetical protein OJAV_G00174550 [Oryzias javanicus]|uniref:Secreted protein n=1 Tax=Oryzias javanicus TaxID=123683 RepID=A0A3S2LV17_ORYJA|nr:hypothetical protein OJAV_G00174550 [Oryzias javanicus]
MNRTLLFFLLARCQQIVKDTDFNISQHQTNQTISNTTAAMKPRGILTRSLQALDGRQHKLSMQATWQKSFTLKRRAASELLEREEEISCERAS